MFYLFVIVKVKYSIATILKVIWIFIYFLRSPHLVLFDPKMDSNPTFENHMSD